MMIYLVIILTLASLLEGVVFSYPITLFVIGFASIAGVETIVILSFIAGIVLDLLTLRLVGLSSLFFLSLIYLGSRYRKKIYGGTFVYRFLFLIIPYIIYSFLFYKNLNIVNFIGACLFAVLGLLMLSKIFPAVGSKKRLEV